MSEFSDTITDRLLEINKSQNWLAKEISIDRSTLSLYLSGKRKIPNAIIFQIAHSLDFRPDDLILMVARSDIKKKSENLKESQTKFSEHVIEVLNDENFSHNQDFSKLCESIMKYTEKRKFSKRQQKHLIDLIIEGGEGR